MCLYLHSFSRCCIAKSRNHEKFQQNLTLQQFKVIQSHRSGVKRKRICDFLLVINRNFGGFSYRFRDIDALDLKQLVSPSNPCLTPRNGGTPSDINVTYTSLKSTFNKLQFRRWQCGFIFIGLVVVSSQIYEIPRNTERIWPYSSARSSKVIGLGVNRKRICKFLLVINSKDVSPTVFEKLTFKARKWLVFPTTPLFDAPAWREPVRFSGWNLPREY